MQHNILSELRNGFETAFIDGTVSSNLAYKPQFISNNYKEGKKVLSSIEDELLMCDQFQISVAFITMSGITPLLQTLHELEKKNIQGKILTTNYLNFSEPKALEKLNELQNIELKMYDANTREEGFHTKGYIFKKEEIYRIIIGSSNMTSSALTSNREWNTKFVSTEDGEMAQEIVAEFDNLWNSKNSLSFDEFYEVYKQRYEIIKRQREIAKQDEISSLEKYRLKPNSMQVGFITNLKKILDQGNQRALLISATGTGKTYASAFAMRELGFKKVLFLVHREQIAKQAMKSFRNVFGKTKTFGLISGTSRNMDTDFLFATMQMMSKSEIHQLFDKNEFDVIIIDEVHHAGAESYKKIMNFFTPEFWLGMTASPDTNGYNIYSIFNHQIAYEIRLQQALEEDLLCPFHYFGITDLEIENTTFDDTAGIRNFNLLVSDSRVKYILEKAIYYGFSGERVKGLIFCSRKDEARELASKFNTFGYRSEVLTGDDSQEKREEVIERLTDDENTVNQLDYIFTVDIFNEGIDVPEINQVIMLRPTESPVVFIQQLGRGLRKFDNKEYVVILDFIGNYMNNFMIPIALSGDRTYNKDSIRKYVMEGSRIIPGSSTIHFDEISKKRIFASIDKVSTTKKLLTEKYKVLKNRLGRIPTILEFYESGEIDPILFIEYAGSYHQFLKIADNDYKVELSLKEISILEFISKNLVNGKRPHELIILQFFLRQGEFRKWEVQQAIKEAFQIEHSNESFESAINVLNGNFMNTQSERAKYSDLEIFVEQAGYYSRMMSFYKRIQNVNFYSQTQELIELGLKRYEDLYRPAEDNLGFAIYQKYSRKDVCRILNWEKDDSSTIYGYKIKNKTCPIFVTYEKKDNIANSTKYEDAFLSTNIFNWMTRSRVSEESREAQEIIHYKERDLKILLFVKKSDGEGTDFYYMGPVTPINWKQTVIKNDLGKQLPIMNFQLKLQHSVREDIYDYFTS